jgi:hypothetical protein
MGARHWLASALLCLLAGAAASQTTTQAPLPDEIEARRELVTAAFDWLDATLARDYAGQSAFYPERMQRFYLWRDTPKSAVLAEKRRVFEQARTIDIRIDAPQLLVDPGGRSGRMYFRKSYAIEGKRNRTGEVLQELRWEKQADGWKIVSERDLRVIN